MNKRFISIFASLAFALSSAVAMAQDVKQADSTVTQQAASEVVSANLPLQSNQQGMGKLVMDVKEFKSDIELKPKVETTLKAGGLDWGVKEGQMVITMVNKNFVGFEFPNFTRYGTSGQMELPSGEYTVTGIGLVASTAFSVEKILNKGAYLNFDVLKFKVEAGKTTTITIQPQIKKNATFLLNFFLPYYYATVTTDAGTTEEIALTEKLPSSVPWSTYDGPLKFKAK